MRSVESALAVDYFRRGALIFPLVLLAMIALPIWLLSILDAGRTLGPSSPEAVVLHVTLTLSLGFGAAVSVFQAHGRLSRFFMRPVSSARLVTCQMGLGMATVAGMYVVSASIVNLMGVQWPVIGPALYLATSLACALAAIWSLEGNVLSQLIGCSATTVPLFIWFNRRYGATIMGDWETMWLNPTASEALTLGAISAVAYGVAIRSVAHVRRGDVWDFAALMAWLEQVLSSEQTTAKFKTSWQAQLWCEAREKMVLAPVCLLWAAIIIGGVAWVSHSFPTAEFLNFTLIMPVVGMTTVLPLVYGILVGNCSQEKRPGMKHFLATRPVTDQFIAAALLRTAASALFWAWSGWLGGVAVVMGLVYLTGNDAAIRRALMPENLEAGNAVATLFGVPFLSWTICTLLGSLMATGRTRLIAAVIGGVIAGWFLFGLLKAYAPEHVFDLFVRSWLIGSSGVALAGTIWAYIAARRLRLLNPWAMIVAVGMWAVAAAVTVYVMSIHGWPVILRWNVIGTLALGILPLATMPLAVRWNRHR